MRVSLQRVHRDTSSLLRCIFTTKFNFCNKTLHGAGGSRKLVGAGFTVIYTVIDRGFSPAPGMAKLPQAVLQT